MQPGFFAWYQGLSLDGTVRVSQLQLQAFMSMLLAVIALVYAGRKMPIQTSTPAPSPGRNTP